MTLPQYDWIAHHAEFSPHKTAQIDMHSGRSFTYAQMHDRVDRLAAWMQNEASIVAGDRVSVLAHNSTDVYEIFFAGQRVGAMVLPRAAISCTRSTSLMVTTVLSSKL